MYLLITGRKVLRMAYCSLFLWTGTVQAQTLKPITLEDIWSKGTFALKNVPGFNALKDGKRYTQLDATPTGGQEINIYQLSNGRKLKTIWSQPGSGPQKDHYVFSNDEQKLLLFAEATPVYRRSILYRVQVYDLQRRSAQPLDDSLVLHASFNPVGDKVAYVRQNNIYIKDLRSGSVTAVTTDGVVNQVINGNCDWVYEEEFEFTKAFQWSPDGQYLAYYRFDERQVKEYTIPFYEASSTYPRQYTYKYPKAGEDNSVVSIHVYDVRTARSTPVDIGTEKDQYIPRIGWTGVHNRLWVYQLNRLQNKLALLLAEPATGRSREIYQEESKYYIEINDNLTFLPDGESLVLNSERDGFNHLYQWNWVRKQLTQLTRGAWDVAQMLGVDEKKQRIYYTAGVHTPLERKLYVVDWNGKQSRCLTPEAGMHDIVACGGFQYFLDKHSRINTVPVYTLINHKGDKVRVLEDNRELKKKMEEYAFSTISLTRLPNGKGALLNAWVIKPLDFDETKKYPVLMYQYSGPGSQEVLDKFPVGNYFWHQMMAQKGYIVVCTDGTGTGARGVAFKKKTYLALGKYESEDQIAVARYLAQQPYVDSKRIGIWGWSFGGFMSATCILKGADVFKTAVAVAPVTNWRFYDNIYTERYMRRPVENPGGYDENAPEQMADQLKGNLLLVHGTADDNVHFQNAVVFTDQLIRANKQFESAYYPNRHHGISGGNTRLQLFKKITEYIEHNL